MPRRMTPDEYFWNYDFRFDLRDATRGEQDAVRVCFLAQKLPLDGMTQKHIDVVETVLGKRAEARDVVASMLMFAGPHYYDA